MSGIISERVGVAKKIKMRNPQIRAIGNIFYSVEPVLFPRTVRRNRTVGNHVVGNSAVLLVKFLRCVHIFSYEFSLDFHIFQGSLYTSKGTGNRVSCILAIYFYFAGVHRQIWD